MLGPIGTDQPARPLSGALPLKPEGDISVVRHSISLPIVTVLILLLTAALVAGCGGGESATATSTPPVAQPPEEPSPTPTSDSQATEERTPTAGPDATTGSGLSSDVQRYIDITCPLVQEDDPETWGEAVEQLEEVIERIRKNSPPEVLRGYFEAQLGVVEPVLEFIKSMDSDERADFEALSVFRGSTEMQPAFAAIQEAVDKMDRDLVTAVTDAGC